MRWGFDIKYHDISHLGLDYSFLEIMDKTMIKLSKSNPEGILLYDFDMAIMSKLIEKEKKFLSAKDAVIFTFICLNRYIKEINVKLSEDGTEIVDVNPL